MNRPRGKGRLLPRLIVLSLLPLTVLSHESQALNSLPPTRPAGPHQRRAYQQKPQSGQSVQPESHELQTKPGQSSQQAPYQPGSTSQRLSTSSNSQSQDTGAAIIPIGDANAKVFSALSEPPFPDGADLQIWMPQCKDYQNNNKSPPVCSSMGQKIRSVVGWPEVFQLATATATYIAGAGVGKEVLNDPLATAEGTLNFPIIVSQLTLIMTEVFLIDNTVYTWDPYAVAKLIEDISIVAAAFALMSQDTLDTLFNLKSFPNSVEVASSYGGSTAFHAGMIAVHGVQAAVLNWNKISSALMKQFLLTQGYATRQLPLFKKDAARTQNYLKTKKWTEGMQQLKLDKNVRDAMQQSRDLHVLLGCADPNANVDLNKCKTMAKEKLSHVVQVKGGHGGHSHGHGGHSHDHGHGMLAILADIIAHGVSLPTFFIAWVLTLASVPVNDLAIGWVAQLSTIVLLGCLQHAAVGDAIKTWKQLGGQAPASVAKELVSKIDQEFQPKYSKYVEKVEFTTRKITSQDAEIYYVSFYVSVFPDCVKSLSDIQEEAEMELRKIAHAVKAYDFSRLDRGVKEPTRIVYWRVSGNKVTEEGDVTGTEETAQSALTTGHSAGQAAQSSGTSTGSGAGQASGTSTGGPVNRGTVRGLARRDLKAAPTSTSNGASKTASRGTSKTFAQELDPRGVKEEDVVTFLTQQLEDKNVDPILKVMEEAYKKTAASQAKMVAPLKNGAQATSKTGAQTTSKKPVASLKNGAETPVNSNTPAETSSGNGAAVSMGSTNRAETTTGLGSKNAAEMAPSGNGAAMSMSNKAVTPTNSKTNAVPSGNGAGTSVNSNTAPVADSKKTV